MLPLSCSLCNCLARYIAVVPFVSICLVCDSSIVATCPSIPAARFAFRLCFIRFVLLFVVIWTGETKQNKGRGLVDRKQVKPSSNFNVGRPKASLLFFFFGDFRSGVSLFVVFLVIYKYRNR